MRSPSVNRLETAFDITRKDANLIKRLVKSVDNPSKLEGLIDQHVPLTGRYVRSLFHCPYNSRGWRRTVVLHAINGIVDGHGVEALEHPKDRGDYSKPPAYEYINFGDTYALTLVYKSDTDNLYLASWGDIAERMPRGSEW